METMNDLILHFLQDMYDAEKRSLRSIQKMARAASDDDVKQAFLQHRDASQQHISRLERVFELVTGKRPRGKTCAAMEGLTDEVDEAIDEGKKGPVLDAALIASAQAIDHYEIARYGAMAAWARQAGKDEIAGLFAATLAEEKQNDEALTALAERGTNPAAAEVVGDDEAPAAEPEPEPKPRRAARAAKQPEPTPEPPAAKGRSAMPAATTSRRGARK